MNITAPAILLKSILPNLDKCKQNGPFRWTACCPAHKDKSPSFQIKLADDGRLLFHCFAGCSIDEICSSLGIDVQDLFPDDKRIQYPALVERQRANIPTQDSHYIAHFKNAVKKGHKPAQAEVQAYLAAVEREANKK